MISRLRRTKHRRLLAFSAAIVALPALAGLSGQPVLADSDKAPEDKAREIAGRRVHGSMKDMRVVDVTHAQFPLSGRAPVAFKIEDGRTGQTHVVLLDRGREVDPRQLEADEAAAYAARYGRFDPVLAERVAQSGPADRLPVTIWLNEPEYAGPERPPVGSAPVTQEEADRFLRQVDEQRAAFVAALTAEPTRRLAALGARAASDPYVPKLNAELPVSSLREINTWPEINRIYLQPGVDNTMDDARATIRANVVHNSGNTGTGVRTAQIERDGRIATSNPYLAGITQNATGVCATPQPHPTAVAGIIHSTHSTRKGISPGTSHWAGGGCGANGSIQTLENAANAATDWGAKVINVSYKSDIIPVPVTTLNDTDKFYDDLSFFRYRTVVVAAGNESGSCESTTARVTSPSKGFNVLAVGAFDDRGDSLWSQDKMWSCSSFIDPTSQNTNGREKPDLAAPGVSIQSTTTASPWTGSVGSGTSYAAPMVTGGAALLIQKNGNLTYWPVAIRAILQATAWHNIEGDSRLSEEDGVGGVDLERAYNVAAGFGGTGWNARTYNCSSLTDLQLAAPFFGAQRRTRIAIAWDNNPNVNPWPNRPGADVDLKVYDPDGKQVAGSNSWDNTYEIVDFTTAVAGTYKIVAKRGTNCASNPSSIGVAWYNRDS